ncbi:pseudo histidine-containing phosphotransfer protein 5-like isoform X2 [Phragmites australis]|uniref:pseudo histidine-containing phosphotransfer protein 5-like isoform X2 n=1 Tax=Phragmites australis TaxID=29695 RepID=UPI002D777564|nr:pseudo histidine-containing phosphotransfer protein 5-like isoform X2 [Phragmites australis]
MWSSALREPWFVTIGSSCLDILCTPWQSNQLRMQDANLRYPEIGISEVSLTFGGKIGYLDEQFCQVEDLQDEASPNFAEEVVTLFFKDSARLMSNIELALEKYPKDFNRWDAYMQQLKGSCSSIGASRMKCEFMSFRDYCGQGNVEGCMRSFQKVKREHTVLRQKLETYFQLLRQAGPAGAATRPVM